MPFDVRPGIRRIFRLKPRGLARIHADVDDELESVIASRVEGLVARGMSPSDARIEALRRLGADVDDARRQLHHSAEQRERHMNVREYLDNVWLDVRYAARGLLRRPGFTMMAVATLAIGIGATTAIFSAVNVMLLRPLPYQRPDELMNVTMVVPPRGDRPGMDEMVWSYPKFVVFRDAQTVFSNVALYSDYQFTLSSGEVERIPGESVGASLFRILGLRMARGRDFDPSLDAHVGAPKEAILSDRLWQRRFNADSSIIGKTIDMDRQAYTVIGVAPPGFRGLSGEAEIFIPVTSRSAEDLNEPWSHEFWMIGRRRPGVTDDEARAAVKVLGARVNAAYPDRLNASNVWGAKAELLNAARLAPSIRQSLLILFGAVGLVLLIACVNVANLLIGRASARRREIALRLAIGANRGRLVRLLLIESVLLAGIGAIASLAVAWAGVRWLGTIDPSTTLRISRDSALGAVAFSSITLDWTALAFTMGTALLVGIAFGLVPAVSATGASLADMMKDGRAASHGAGSRGARRILVVAEVALSVILLAGSGLMIRSLANLLSVKPGFDAGNVLTVRLSVPVTSRDSMPAFYERLLERVRGVAGVTDAALSNCAPLGGACSGTVMQRLDKPPVGDDQLPSVAVHWASPTWFSTMHVPLVSGRMFTTADRIGSQKVVIVNQAAATKFWPNESPIGKRVMVGQGGMDDATVVGIVGDVRLTPDSAAGPATYVPYYESPRQGMIVFVRTQRDAASFAPAVSRAIHDIGSQYPIYDIKTMDERAMSATARSRFVAMLLGLFALTALVLAAIGIYGVMALSVMTRTREIGIRIALGADRNRVQGAVVAEGMRVAAIGAVIGLAVAFPATRALRTMLFGIGSNDPLTYVVMIVILAALAATASWIPARRAARVDPMEALRAD